MMRQISACALRASACMAMLLSSAPCWAAFANLSDWAGTNNMAGANNYAVTSSTSAGGTFAERKASEASLSDQTLVGGPFSWTSTLSMQGSMTFSGSFDPVAFLGWYSSTNLNNRLGWSLANPVPAGNAMRVQAQWANATNAGVVSSNVAGSGSGSASNQASTLAPGTYSWTFNYDGAGHIIGTFGSISFNRTFPNPSGVLSMDRFGFLQKSSADDDAHTITWTVSNINYTGETQVPEPTALVLVGCLTPLAFRRRR